RSRQVRTPSPLHTREAARSLRAHPLRSPKPSMSLTLRLDSLPLSIPQARTRQSHLRQPSLVSLVERRPAQSRSPLEPRLLGRPLSLATSLPSQHPFQPPGPTSSPQNMSAMATTQPARPPNSARKFSPPPRPRWFRPSI